VQTGSSPRELVGDYLSLALMVNPLDTPKVVVADPDDDHVLACAIAAEADLIVSGDVHLLSMGEYRRIRIVNAVRAVEEINVLRD
jgi:uncharacterized protein